MPVTSSHRRHAQHSNTHERTVDPYLQWNLKASVGAGSLGLSDPEWWLPATMGSVRSVSCHRIELGSN
jgi:hypothetical protein